MLKSLQPFPFPQQRITNQKDLIIIGWMLKENQSQLFDGERRGM